MSNAPLAPEESPEPAGPPIKVLLVDDQRMIGEAVRRLMHDQPDIAFHYCADPSDAIDRANELQPDVILQDLVMPKIDGFELVRRYRANPATTNTRIIVLSGSDDAETKDLAAAAGANGFMVKLPPKADLLAQIRLHSPFPR